MEQNNDSSIIQRARHGDQDAISRLYNETKNYAYFVARRYLQNDEDIADVLQEAYISVFSKLNTFEDGKPFKPWLHTIVTNKCLNYIKSRRAVFVSQDEIGELASDDEEIIPAAWLERAERRRDIMRIIDGLPEGQRMAVTLFYFEGLSISDMAGIMGVAEGTVKAHLYFGRKTIKEEVLREEKKGNKLYAIVPLPLLTQLFELEAETTVMPESLSQKVWEGTLQELVSNGVVTGLAAASAPNAAVSATVKTGMTLATKIIVGVVAAAVVTAGVIFLPPLFNSSDDTTPPGVTDTSPIHPGTETPASTPDTEAPNNTPNTSDNTIGEEGANLTGQPKLTLGDIEDWGFSKGMTFDELRNTGLIYDDPYGMTLDEFLEDREQNPDTYANWARGFSTNPEVFVRTDTLLIDGVQVYDVDSALGPRGLAIGMTAAEVVNLFYCDNPLIMEYVKNPSQNTAPEYGARMYIDAEESLEGSINILDGQIESLNYGIWRNAFLNIYMENNRVKEFRVYFVYMDD